MNKGSGFAVPFIGQFNLKITPIANLKSVAVYDSAKTRIGYPPAICDLFERLLVESRK